VYRLGVVSQRFIAIYDSDCYICSTGPDSSRGLRYQHTEVHLYHATDKHDTASSHIILVL